MVDNHDWLNNDKKLVFELNILWKIGHAKNLQLDQGGSSPFHYRWIIATAWVKRGTLSVWLLTSSIFHVNLWIVPGFITLVDPTPTSQNWREKNAGNTSRSEVIMEILTHSPRGNVRFGWNVRRNCWGLIVMRWVLMEYHRIPMGIVDKYYNCCTTRFSF